MKTILIGLAVLALLLVLALGLEMAVKREIVRQTSGSIER